MDHSNVVYEKEVATGGRCIYCRDEGYRDEFMAVALALYVQLRWERREVERAYTADKED
jgi:radical SAM superfamily enzyme